MLMNQKLDRAGTAGKFPSAQHSPRHGHRVTTSHTDTAWRVRMESERVSKKSLKDGLLSELK